MQLFINKFQKGSKENANVGMANIVGIDVYSKKGLAILAKKSTAITSGFTGAPHFIETTGQGAFIWIQCSDGSVVYSSDGGNNFQPTSTPFPTGPTTHGNGLILYENFIHAFTDDAIYVWQDTGPVSGVDPTNGAWVSFKTGLQAPATNPISALHFPKVFENSKGFYYGNADNTTPGTTTIGFIGQVGTTLYNPAGAQNTDYYYIKTALSLPLYTYSVTSIDFLPPSSLAICCVDYQNPTQGGVLLTWDTITNNLFTPPLRLYSDILATSTVTAGIKQLFNRNQVLYTVMGGNHAIYETNSSSYNITKNIGLNSNVRQAAGQETDYPVFFNSYPKAITVVGNKLLTGTAVATNTATYPPNNINTAGIFPIGVWSIYFNEDGSKSIACEYILPLGNSLVSPGQTGNYAKITCLKSISTVSNSTNQLLVGFAYNSSSFPNTYGVAAVDLFNYIDNIEYTAIESELFEIGTAISPKQIGNIEVNLAKNLLTGQTINLSYRKSQDAQWTTLTTYTGDGTKNYYSLTKNQIGPTQFLQIRVRMATNSANATFSPQLRTVIINPMENN